MCGRVTALSALYGAGCAELLCAWVWRNAWDER